MLTAPPTFYAPPSTWLTTVTASATPWGPGQKRGKASWGPTPSVRPRRRSRPPIPRDPASRTITVLTVCRHPLPEPKNRRPDTREQRKNKNGNYRFQNGTYRETPQNIGFSCYDLQRVSNKVIVALTVYSQEVSAWASWIFTRWKSLVRVQYRPLTLQYATNTPSIASCSVRVL